jgi:MFS family permease
MILLLVVGYAAIAHFNRVSISVAGAEVFIEKHSKETTTEAQQPATPEKRPQSFHGVFSKTRMGWVYTTFLIVYTLCMLPGGWVIDRIGSGKAMTFLGIGMGSFVALTGALGWLMDTPDQLWIGLLIIRGLAGMCSAPLHPGAAHVVSDVASINGRTTANGMVTAGALLGIAFSYPMFGKLMDLVTWGWAFVFCGAVMVGYGLLWSAIAAPKLPGPHASRMDQELAEEAAAGIPWHLLRRRDLWLITLSYFAYSYFQYLFFYWMENDVEDVRNVPDVQARQGAFIVALSQGAGMAIGGLGNDTVCRLFGITRGRRGIMLAGMMLCAFLTVIAIVQHDFSHVVLFMSLALGCEGLCEGIYWTSATEIGGKCRGFACGFLNTGGNVGGLISPVLTPKIAEVLGWTPAIGVACLLCAAGGAIWMWIASPSDPEVPMATSRHEVPDST